MFDMISAIENRLREKSAKKIGNIGDISSIYHGNIGSVAHVRISLIFQ